MLGLTYPWKVIESYLGNKQSRSCNKNQNCEALERGFMSVPRIERHLERGFMSVPWILVTTAFIVNSATTATPWMRILLLQINSLSVLLTIADLTVACPYPRCKGSWKTRISYFDFCLFVYFKIGFEIRILQTPHSA